MMNGSLSSTDHPSSIRRRASDMFQVERLRVVNETLKQIYNEVHDGKIEEPKTMKSLIEESSLALLHIAHRIEDSEVEENEDS